MLCMLVSACTTVQCPPQGSPLTDAAPCRSAAGAVQHLSGLAVRCGHAVNVCRCFIIPLLSEVSVGREVHLLWGCCRRMRAELLPALPVHPRSQQTSLAAYASLAVRRLRARLSTAASVSDMQCFPCLHISMSAHASIARIPRMRRGTPPPAHRGSAPAGPSCRRAVAAPLCALQASPTVMSAQ